MKYCRARGQFGDSGAVVGAAAFVSAPQDAFGAVGDIEVVGVQIDGIRVGSDGEGNGDEIHQVVAIDVAQGGAIQGVGSPGAQGEAFNLPASVQFIGMDKPGAVGGVEVGTEHQFKFTIAVDIPYADDAFIAESILEPTVKIVEGFPPVMPPYALYDEEISYLIAYIKTLK